MKVKLDNLKTGETSVSEFARVPTMGEFVRDKTDPGRAWYVKYVEHFQDAKSDELVAVVKLI